MLCTWREVGGREVYGVAVSERAHLACRAAHHSEADSGLGPRPGAIQAIAQHRPVLPANTTHPC
jgi:hypothetical protein